MASPAAPAQGTLGKIFGRSSDAFAQGNAASPYTLTNDFQALQGLTAGQVYTLQNRSVSGVIVNVSSTEPTSSSDGFFLSAFGTIDVRPASGESVWAKGLGRTDDSGVLICIKAARQ